MYSFEIRQQVSTVTETWMHTVMSTTSESNAHKHYVQYTTENPNDHFELIIWHKTKKHVFSPSSLNKTFLDEDPLEHKIRDENDYDPDALLNAIIIRLQLKNDAALCRVLAVSPQKISKIRHRNLPIGASMLIRMTEVNEIASRMSDKGRLTISGLMRSSNEN